MHSQKLVTIIIPMHDRVATIGRCLDSIAMQNGIQHFAIVVVDNNSSDASADVVRRWSTTHHDLCLTLIDEPAPGAPAARNKGLSIADTPYVMFFDSDDEMLQGHLKRLLDGIASNPDADILGWDIHCELPDGRGYRATFHADRPLVNHLVYASLATQRYAVKTGFVRSVGAWNPDMEGWNDFELGVRLILARPVMVKLDSCDDKPLVMTYFTPGSITGSSFSVSPAKWENSLDAIENCLQRGCPEALCWVAYRRAVLAGLYAREGACNEARRLRRAATAPHFGKVKSAAIYHLTRIFGKGARFLATRILPAANSIDR